MLIRIDNEIPRAVAEWTKRVLDSELSKLEAAQLGSRLLNPDDQYDGAANGALAEIWASCELGMEKAARGQNGFDGWINERKLSVKSKTYPQHYSASGYVPILPQSFDQFDDLLIVFIDSSAQVRRAIGPFPFDEEIRQLGRRRDGRRYTRFHINDIARHLQIDLD